MNPPDERIYGRTPEYSVDALRGLFQALDWVDVALLFGSRAVGNSHERSDYDFALLMNERADGIWGKRAHAYAEITLRTKLDDCDADIVDLESANVLILDSIKEKYVVLKGNEDEVSRLLEKEPGSCGN